LFVILVAIRSGNYKLIAGAIGETTVIEDLAYPCADVRTLTFFAPLAMMYNIL
jgi:hypothetical protein